MPSDFSPDRFADKLASCSETTASIQSLCAWVLFHRRSILEMVEVWYNSYTMHSQAHQIVHLYVANDVMQTGMRKYGRDIPEAFAPKLILAIAFTMTNGTPKIQDVIRKLVALWRERQVLSDQVIDKMSDMCSTVVKARKDALKDTIALAKQAAAKSAEETEAFVLQDIPDAVESSITRETIQKIEDLEGEVVSTDLLSDRMFQLSSNLNYFMQAQEDGETDWSQLELPVFEIDLNVSAQHVATFRQHLEKQLEKRTELIQHFKTFTNYVVIDPEFIPIAARMDSEEADIQALHALCMQAATSKEQKRMEYNEQMMSTAPTLTRRHSMMETSTPHVRLEHRRSDSELLHHHEHGMPWDYDAAAIPPQPSSSQFYEYAPSRYESYQAPPDEWSMNRPSSSYRDSPRDYPRSRDRSRSRSRSPRSRPGSWRDERRRDSRSNSRERNYRRPSRFHDNPPPQMAPPASGYGYDAPYDDGSKRYRRY
ncbi:Regulation of nuclear pre-mRNA domain containing protein 1B [Aphanomyces cochlioides]|nr:Regulation of nuclear pre-mRNA domain containing protein 1B [Aphanomyces cochlioides]